MSTNELIGTWALVATEWRRADGRHANPFGPGAVGILMYDAAGNMSAQVMRADRAAVPDDQPDGIETAMASAFAGYIAYFGRYEIDTGRSVVMHYVAGSAFPEWVGGTHERRFAVEGDRLTLSDSVVAADGTATEASTTWRRLA
jgi:hypothetical protein